MSHFLTVVLTEPNGKTVTELLSRYDEQLPVPRWKRRLDAAEIAGMAEHYGAGLDQLDWLARQMPGWDGSEGGVDAEGLFAWSTRNPVGYWDWWTPLDYWPAWLGGSGRLPNGMLVRKLPAPPLETHVTGTVAAICRAEGRPIPKLPAEERYSGCAYALVTPTGDWHARGRMGMFGMSYEAETWLRWSARYFEILSGHTDCHAWAIDCHV